MRLAISSYTLAHALIVNVIILLIGLGSVCEALEDKKPKLLVVINCNDHPYHLNYARLTQRHILSQAADLRSVLTVDALISVETWPDLHGLWTFFPIIDELLDTYSRDGYDWVLFSTEHTEVNLSILHSQVLANHDPSRPQFVGRALHDADRVITHHFADTKLAFPDSLAGFLVSWELLKADRKKLHDFSIDPDYELALALYNDGRGTPLTHRGEFCSPAAEATDQCATVYRPESLLCPAGSTHGQVTEDDLFVMVKTGEVFHQTRVPQQQELWTSKVKNLEICSEKADPTIPTVRVDAPNTEKGHCAKFHAMLRRAYKEPHISSKKYLVVVDDDTLMNVTRLARLLSCYDETTPLVLGQRYGFKASRKGYDYVTGGGGLVLNSKALTTLVTSGRRCGVADAPDDMTLGMWLRMVDIPIQHSVLFHQAPPSSYPVDYLEPLRYHVVSFHKLQPDDPQLVMSYWLSDTEPAPSDDGAAEAEQPHDEL